MTFAKEANLSQLATYVGGEISAANAKIADNLEKRLFALYSRTDAGSD
jgi:hypothetical protein